MAYNDNHRRNQAIRHYVLPGPAGITFEAILALIILLAMYFNHLDNKLRAESLDTNPITYSKELGIQAWSLLNGYEIFHQGLLYLMWAVFGGLLYILIFRLFQLAVGTSEVLHKGRVLIRSQHSEGLIKWLASLHDFMVKGLIAAAGVILLATAIFICLSFAGQQAYEAVREGLPHNTTTLAVGFMGAFLGLRLSMAGLCLLLPTLRSRYLSV